MVVVTPVMSNLKLETRESQISQQNFDYSERKPYHHYNFSTDSKN